MNTNALTNLLILLVVIVESLPLKFFSNKVNIIHQNRITLQTSQLFDNTNTDDFRIENWKKISKLEKDAVELLLLSSDKSYREEAIKCLIESINLKNQDPFLQLASEYNEALKANDKDECDRIMIKINEVGLPPHLNNLIQQNKLSGSKNDDNTDLESPEDVDPGSTFSDTVTEKIRIKVSSFYDSEKSDAVNGKYMFWYKVAIYNEGPEPVQIVARMWEIEKCRGEKEIVRGAGIMSTQPIIAPGDVFTYQSVCPLKVFPGKGKRVIGSMSGAYTMCKGNMGQHNFTVKVGKFNLIIPESVASGL